MPALREVKTEGVLRLATQVGNPILNSGHLPTLLCSGLECVFPESTLKIFPGACSSFPVTVIKKKKIDKKPLWEERV